MPGNTFGKIFQVTSFGESHGEALGVVIDGFPAGITIDTQALQAALDRRRPGQSTVTTSRNEADQAQILSGIFQNKSTGMPICVIVHNQDQRSSDYDKLQTEFRPGHADAVFQAKYGHRDHRGGGRSSGRETVSRVIAGYFAELILPKTCQVIAHTKQVGELIAEKFEPDFIEQNPVRTADPDLSEQMQSYIEQLKINGDSTGALVEVQILNPPQNLGEPVFDKIKADLGKALFSLGTVTGVSYGAGFGVTSMTGKNYIANPDNFGGILGGIATGETITLQIAVKPTSTTGEKALTGRHDPCIAPRIIPVIEAMIKIVFADHYLRNKISQEL